MHKNRVEPRKPNTDAVRVGGLGGEGRRIRDDGIGLIGRWQCDWGGNGRTGLARVLRDLEVQPLVRLPDEGAGFLVARGSANDRPRIEKVPEITPKGSGGRL
ncbi:hypothetical protein IMZ48_27660 [Candidatus Bathyarchaeota archaeon]|nr:hypothetical protein [Candidatus Bathyarchaeota archaeon]